MDSVTYLIARGWRRSGSFPGTGGDQWYDTFGRRSSDLFELQRNVVPMTAEQAERIQLNRDAQLRDYVDERRPKLDAV